MSDMPESPAERGPRGRPWRLAALPIVLVLLALGLAWQWFASRAELGALREEMARQLRNTDTDSRDARVLARQAEESVREMQARLGALEGKLAESQNQQLALEALYQELSRGRDEWALAEVDQILSIAAQQLQLAGNVNAALAALQTADARLARADRPQFLPVRKALARDIERLKAAPSVDLLGLALKIDQVIASVDSLQFPADQAAAAPRPAASQAQGFWTRLGGGVWTEMKQLVQVRNVERQDLPLVSPSQAYFIRENLRLRLLNARIDLVERNQSLFRSDVQAALDWLGRYFDPRSRPVASASAELRQLSASGISIETPDISGSLAAVRSFKASLEKTAK